MSLMFEIVIAHLKVGAQKNIVNGPAGWANKDLTYEGKGSLRTAAYKSGTIPTIYFI